MARCEPGCTCRRHQSRGRPPGTGVISIDERFWRHVMRGSYDQCWPWLGATVRRRGDGLEYGKFSVRQGELGQVKESTLLAHRVAFFLVRGRWPEPNGLHGCDNPLCCNAENPAHVHEGTLKDNTREMFERGRHAGPPIRTGIDANRAKLTDDQAREIIIRYRAGGVSQASLAAEYGVAQPSISSIIRGKRRSLQEEA